MVYNGYNGYKLKHLKQIGGLRWWQTKTSQTHGVFPTIRGDPKNGWFLIMEKNPIKMDYFHPTPRFFMEVVSSPFRIRWPLRSPTAKMMPAMPKRLQTRHGEWWRPRADRFFSRAITPKSGPKINGSNWVFVHPYNWSYGPLVISGRGPTLNKGWWTAYSMGLVDLGLVRHEMQNNLQM